MGNPGTCRGARTEQFTAKPAIFVRSRTRSGYRGDSIAPPSENLKLTSMEQSGSGSSTNARASFSRGGADEAVRCFNRRGNVDRGRAPAARYVPSASFERARRDIKPQLRERVVSAPQQKLRSFHVIDPRQPACGPERSSIGRASDTAGRSPAPRPLPSSIQGPSVTLELQRLRLLDVTVCLSRLRSRSASEAEPCEDRVPEDVAIVQGNALSLIGRLGAPLCGAY